ncbi:pyridine nucleotide-disulfide oxidoreductase family protein, partial [Vibrio parahaemolyticus V-223/04]
QILLTVH